MESLLDVIYEGRNFDDPTHLNALYGAFRDCGDSGELETDELERIKAMKESFTWIPVPPHYFTRFQKSSEMSRSLRERGLKELASTEPLALLRGLRGQNLAIAFAPSNSPELALALEKRADLLIRLQEPELAQKDILSASKNTSYPRQSAGKLIDLQSRCSGLAYETEAKTRRRLKVSGDRIKETKKYTDNAFFSLKSRNPTVDNISASTEIDYKPTCGRRIVATRHIQPGEVLMIDEPYALILERMLKWDMDHCTNCSKPILAGIPCDSCTFGWFCSKACLEEGSGGMHKYEHMYLGYLKCSQLMCLKGLLATRIISKVGPEELYRIFSSQDPLFLGNSTEYSGEYRGEYSKETEEDPRYRGYDGNGAYCSGSYLPIFHLISHPHVNVLKAKSSAFKALLLTNLLQDTTHFFDRFKFNDDFSDFKDFVAALILRHMDSIDYNAITLSQLVTDRGDGSNGSGGQAVRYGAGVYPVLCLINHSCDPNCVPVRSLRALKTSVVAMKALRPGDEVTFSYAPHFSLMEFGERRKFLFDKYNFNCACEACASCWGPASRSFYVAESQCNTCGKYLLIGQCPKCTRKDSEIKKDLVIFGSQVEEVNELLEKGNLIEAMELIKPCLTFATDVDKFSSNFAPALEFQDIFKRVLVALVNL